MSYIKRLLNPSQPKTLAEWGDLNDLFPEAARLLSQKPVNYDKIRQCMDKSLSVQLTRIENLSEKEISDQNLTTIVDELIDIDSKLERISLFCLLSRNLQDNKFGVQKSIPLFQKVEQIVEMIGGVGLNVYRKLSEKYGDTLPPEKNSRLIMAYGKYWQKYDNPLNSDSFAEAMDKLERVTQKQEHKSFRYLDEKHRTLMAEGLAGIFQHRLDNVRRSKFSNITDAFLSDNKLEREVFENFLAAAEDNLTALSQADAAIGNAQNVIVSNKYSWNEAKEIIIAAYAQCHPELGKIVEKAFDEKWIYATEKGIELPMVMPGLHPDSSATAHPYMVVNFDGSIEDIRTLGHEMAHVLHRYMSAQNQLVQNTDASHVLNELPACFGELLVRNILLKRAKGVEEQLAIRSIFDGRPAHSIAGSVPSIRLEQEFYDHVAANGKSTTYQQLDQICRKHVKVNGVDIPLQNLDMTYLKFDALGRARHPLAQVLAFSLEEQMHQDQNFGEKFLQILKAGNTLSPKQAWEELLGSQPFEQREYWDKKFQEYGKRLSVLNAEWRELGEGHRRYMSAAYPAQAPDYIIGMDRNSSMARHGREFT